MSPYSAHKNKPTTPTKAPSKPPITGTVFPIPPTAAALLVEIVAPPLAVPVPAPVAAVPLTEVVPASLPVDEEVVSAFLEDGEVGAAPPDVVMTPEGKVIVPIPWQSTSEKEDSTITSASVSCAGQKVE